MTQERSELRRILTEQDLSEASTIMANSFINLNKLWHKFTPKFEEAYDTFYYKLGLSMEQGMAYGFYFDGKLIGTTAHFPLEYYLNIPKKPNQAKIFNLLDSYGSEVEKVILGFNDRRGEAIFASSTAMAPEHSLKGYSLWFWLEGLKTMQQVGYKTFYSWLSSPVSRFLFNKIGAEELYEVTMKEEEVKGNWLVLVKIDLTKKLP